MAHSAMVDRAARSVCGLALTNYKSSLKNIELNDRGMCGYVPINYFHTDYTISEFKDGDMCH